MLIPEYQCLKCRRLFDKNPTVHGTENEKFLKCPYCAEPERILSNFHCSEAPDSSSSSSSRRFT
jgi:DNA-directed RNA polymerase subunit RPC12/RpoP